MRTGRQATQEVDDTKEKLIQEGAASYPDAVIALREFQRVVQEKCEEVVANRLDELSRATGVKVEESMIWKYPFPGRHTPQRWDGKSVWLYTGVTLGDVGYMYFGVRWEYKKSGEPELNAHASLALKKRDIYEKALAKFKEVGRSAIQGDSHDREISLSDPIPIKEASSFPERLEDLVDRFLQAWQQVGGVKAIRGR